MGTRTVFELSDPGDRDVAPNVVLFANCSHPTEDPRTAFREIGHDSKTAMQMLESLLAVRYRTKGGNHRVGDRMFDLVIGPYDDCEAVHTAHWGTGTMCRITESEEVPVLARLRPSQAKSLSDLVLNASRDLNAGEGDDREADRSFDTRRDAAIEAVHFLDGIGVDVSLHRAELGMAPPRTW